MDKQTISIRKLYYNNNAAEVLEFVRMAHAQIMRLEGEEWRQLQSTFGKANDIAESLNTDYLYRELTEAA